MEDYIWFTCNQKSCIPSLYIDPSIFNWFNRLLKYHKYSNFVENVYDIQIQNVEFREFGVKLVQFKNMNIADKYFTKDIFDGLKEFIQEILLETKLCMPWLPFKNLYCSLDEYDGRVSDLKQCGLWGAVNEVSDYYLNWIERKAFKLFKFDEGAYTSCKETLKQSIYKIKCPVFMTCAYPWHQPWYINYFSYDTDFLAIYICTEEWKQMNLLQDFNIFDILSLDLALCDANDCLNAYIQHLYIREFKAIKNMHNSKKFEHFDLELYFFDKKHFDSIPIDIYLYFLYSYGKHLRFINWSDRDIKNINEIKQYFMIILRTMFPNVKIQKNKYITLKSYTIPSDRIIAYISRSKYGNIILDISNYKHFSLVMLNELLKITQVVRIEINVDLLKIFDMELLKNVGPIVGQKTIYLYSETGGNVRNIENILEYLCRVHVPDAIAVLILIINNCVIYNFDIFKDFKVYSITFQNMDISLTDIQTLCNRQQKLKYLYFIDCTNFGDYHLIKLLDGDFLIKRISIEGKHSITINFYFMLAEQQLKTKSLTKFSLRHILPIVSMKSYEMFLNLTFIRNEVEGQIELRNNFDELVDVFDLFSASHDNNCEMYDFYT